MNKNSLCILVLLQLVFISQLYCHEGYRLQCAEQGQNDVKFFLYLFDNGEAFYKVNAAMHKNDPNYRVQLKQEFRVENDQQDLNEIISFSDSEANDVYKSLFDHFAQKQGYDQEVKIHGKMYDCQFNKLGDLSNYKQYGFQGKLNESFTLQGSVLCLGECQGVQEANDIDVQNQNSQDQHVSVSVQEKLSRSVQDRQSMINQQRTSEDDSREDDLESIIQNNNQNQETQSDQIVERQSVQDQIQRQNTLEQLSNSQQSFQFSNNEDELDNQDPQIQSKSKLSNQDEPDFQERQSLKIIL